MSESTKLIRIVAAVIRDDRSRSLLVRKRGATVFQQPGGKRDPADAGDDLATLARELHEELACELVRGSARLLCHCRAPAANEPGHVVEAAVYIVEVRGAIVAHAEIAELHWIDPAAPDVPVAQLSREHILPLLR